MQAIKCVVVGDGWVTVPISLSTSIIQGRQILTTLPGKWDSFMFLWIEMVDFDGTIVLFQLQIA